MITLFIAAAGFLNAVPITKLEFIRCSYIFMNVPMAQVEIYFDNQGMLKPLAKVMQNGQVRQVSLAEAESKDNEIVHAWISKEIPDGALEMIVYRERAAEGDSKLVNHNVPIGKEMWGNCEYQ